MEWAGPEDHVKHFLIEIIFKCEKTLYLVYDSQTWKYLKFTVWPAKNKPTVSPLHLLEK